MHKTNDLEQMRSAMLRSNTRLLLSGVMLFQFLSMLLITCKTQPLNTQALILALTGAGIFAFFYWLARASAEFEGPDDVPKGEPEE